MSRRYSKINSFVAFTFGTKNVLSSDTHDNPVLGAAYTSPSKLWRTSGVPYDTFRDTVNTADSDCQQWVIASNEVEIWET